MSASNSMGGPITNMILAAIFAPIYATTQSPIIFTFILINIWMAIFCLIPVPTFQRPSFKSQEIFRGGTAGIYIFMGEKWLYVWVAVSVLLFSLFLLLFNMFDLWPFYLLAIAVGGLMAWMFNIFVDK
jgi:Zn-dependent protease